MRKFAVAAIVVVFLSTIPFWSNSTIAASYSPVEDAYASTGCCWPGYSSTDTRILIGDASGNKIYSGWRFSDLGIPAGATINNAYVELVQQEWGWVFETTFAFEDTADASSFSASSTPVDRWNHGVTTGVSWTWAKSTPGTVISSPSLAADLQDLVDSYGAISNVVLIEAPAQGSPAGQHHAWGSIESGQPARLVVEFTGGGSPEPTPTPAATVAPTPTPLPPVVDNQIAFRSWASTDGSTGTVKFDVEAFDFGDNYDATTGVFTAPVDGLYQFSWAVQNESAAIRVNGVIEHELNDGGVVLLQLSKGDAVDIFTQGFNVVGDRRSVYFTGNFVLGYYTVSPTPTPTPTPSSGDITPPSIVSMTITPDAVDVSTSDQPITFTVHVTDSGIGFGPEAGVYVGFRAPTTSQMIQVSFQNTDRISGDANDGTYSKVVQAKHLAEPGTWNLEFISLRDSLGNQVQLGLADAILLGLPTTIQVTS